jgi:hypothetical protein
MGRAVLELPLAWARELFQLSRIGKGELSGRESQPVSVPTLLKFLRIELALQILLPGLALIAHDVVAQHQGLFGEE